MFKILQKIICMFRLVEQPEKRCTCDMECGAYIRVAKAMIRLPSFNMAATDIELDCSKMPALDKLARNIRSLSEELKDDRTWW